MKAPYLKYLGTITGLPTYLVSGERVRDMFDIDFTMGGNEGAYPRYVPKREIWIDDGMHVLDRMATALHEVVERDLMVKRGYDYDRAHEIASKTEIPFRKDMQKRRPTSFDIRRIEHWLAAFESKKSAAELRRETSHLLRR